MDTLKKTVNRLPCKIESTYGLVWGGVFSAFVSWILPFMAERDVITLPAALNTSIVFTAIGVACWFYFYYLFAVGCKPLQTKVSNYVMIFAYMYLLGAIVNIVAMACEVAWINGIGGIAGIIGLIYWIKTGNFLKKNYKGLLGETGAAMIRVMIYFLILIVIAVFYGVFFAGIHNSETAFIISTVIIIAIGLWLFAVSYVTIFARIIDMLESGHVHGEID